MVRPLEDGNTPVIIESWYDYLVGRVALAGVFALACCGRSPNLSVPSLPHGVTVAQQILNLLV
jgi:hypothetical protein